MSLVSSRSLARVSVGVVFTATVTVPLITTAAADTTAGTSSAKSVTVFLKAPNPHGLAALASNHTLSHTARIAAVKKLLPTAAQHEQVATALRAEGFTVTDESSWSVTAKAPATAVATLFGTRPQLPAHATGAQRAAATGALPDLPASLSAVATAVFPTSGGPATFGHIKVGKRAHSPSSSGTKPGDALSGGSENYGYDFQDAYEAPSLTKAGGAPADGSYRSQRLTIATLQFTGWNPSDLSNYAGAAGLPFTSSTLTQVPVDQASVPPADDTEDDVEVDLDQESILSTNPHAHQRAYFAPNTDAGFGDAFSQVVDDVTGVDAYNGGDAHIGALSTSWGGCEAQNTAGAIESTFEPIIASLVAAGVTVFASSGDSGVYDCPIYDGGGNPVDATVGVDYPASSPVVVGVGGTDLTSKTAAFNNGSNWTETGWSCTEVEDCFTDPEATGGSGGGVSDTFTEPAYQSSTLSTEQNGRGGRLVPDIAVDGDPATGFVVDTSDPTLLSSGRFWQVGGTSLASPVSAALFTAMLSDHGQAAGIGDIHPDLYDAPASDFRDITSGSNGDTDLDHAGVGYDTVTGLGAPYWGAIGNRIFDAETPKAEVTTTLPHNHSAKSTRSVKVAWTGTPATRGPKLHQADVTVTQVGSRFPIRYDGAVAPTGSVTLTGKAGRTYLVTLTVTDGNGAQSKPVSKRITVPIDDKSASLSKKGWNRRASSGAVGGSYVETSKRSATATVQATGESYSIVFRVGPSLGKASIAVSGHHVKTVELHAKKDGFKTVHVWGGSSKSVAKRTIKLSVSGSKPIAFDALFAYR